MLAPAAASADIRGVTPTFKVLYGYQVTGGGEHIVALADRGANSRDLYTTDLSSGLTRRLNKADQEVEPNFGGGPAARKGFTMDPDGTRVIYRARVPSDKPWDLYSVAVAGGDRRRLNTPFGADDFGVETFWIPTGMDRVVWSERRGAEHRLFSSNLDGTDRRTLHPSSHVFAANLNAGGSLRFPVAFSPEGDQVVFAVRRLSDSATFLWAVDPNGSNTRSLTPESDWGQLQFSPGGQHIVFGFNDVQALPLANPGNKVTVAPGGSSAIPVDSSRLIYQTTNGGDTGVGVVNYDGTSAFELLPPTEDLLVLFLSSNRRFVYYGVGGSPSGAVYRVWIEDGAKGKKLFDHNQQQFSSTFGPAPTPARDWILSTLDNTVYAMPATPGGPQVPLLPTQVGGNLWYGPVDPSDTWVLLTLDNQTAAYNRHTGATVDLDPRDDWNFTESPGWTDNGQVYFESRTNAGSRIVIFDFIHCGGYLATHVGTGGRDVIEGTNGKDVIVARGGNDLVNGNGGADIVCGGPGNDVLNGGPGSDVIFGHTGDDTVRGNEQQDTLNGGPGTDVLNGGRAADTCTNGETLKFCEN